MCGPANAHATAVALSSDVGGFENRRPAQAFLERWRVENARSRITAYFAYFVARALGNSKGLKFIKDYYGPIVRAHGSIYEKCDDRASLAHSWSTSFVELL